MAAPKITATDRFIEPGTTQVYWVATIAAKAAPTRTELDAGQDLTDEIAGMDGWSVSSDTVDAPDLGTKFTSQVGGMTTAGNPTLTFYRSSDSTDIREILTRGLNGFIVIFWEGDDEGAGPNKMDVFPVQVTARPKQTSMTDPAQIEIDFAVTSEPVEDVDVPVAA